MLCVKTNSCSFCHMHGRLQNNYCCCLHARAKLASWLWQSMLHHADQSLHSRGSLSRHSSCQAPACRASASKGFIFLSCCPQEIICPFHLLCLQVVVFCNFLRPARRLCEPASTGTKMQCKHELEPHCKFSVMHADQGNT